MGRTLTNDFSWSKSRHDKFSECRRAYFFHYYGSWGGWDLKARQDIRELYVLKKLANRFTWPGSMAHDTVKQALNGLRAGRPQDPEKLIGRAHALMREDFRHSRSRSYWTEKRRPEFTGLMEHEYDEPLSPEDWKHAWETARTAIAWFLGSRWVEKAKSLQRKQWLEVDEGFETSSFALDGIKVFAIPDFAYLDDDGTPVVVDWKTGRAREGYDDQVLGYALYLSMRYGFPVDGMKAQLVYLNDGVEHEVRVDKAAVEGFAERFRRSVDRMRTLLLDPTSNLPMPESAFEQTSDLKSCARCVFRRRCGRDERQPRAIQDIAPGAAQANA